MVSGIPPKLLSHRNRINKTEQVSICELECRLEVCRGCCHWFETPTQYRCYKCKCSCDHIIKHKSKCPLEQSKW